MLLSTTFVASLLTIAAASPVGTPVAALVTPVRRQAASLCSQYAYYAVNDYAFNNNLWGQSAATSGSQCTYVDSTSSSGVKWHTTWTWQGGDDNVKSFVNAGKQFAKGLLISNIESIPTSIQWTCDAPSNVRADVAYDIFTAQDPNHDTSSGDYELMIWLARIGGVYPIGSKIASVTLAGYAWDLYSGPNGSMKVFSFLPQGTAWYTSFNTDIKVFFNYLQQNQGFPAGSQNLIVLQQGTEPFTGGPATLNVNSYSVSVNV
ncbi:endoglucanase-like protein A precursor [Setomelanomma holmii]|uniref:Endoglucanase-like protein A n=1 Tax=Setomelanomma holmii TaxID=210430 RepID=A0A9P4LPC2_9PLEO|nr:endoglucanase-like protein A precursor [Setomelanomma holmii]